MPDDGSIIEWYDRLRAGDEEAAARLWRRYFPRLVGLARTRLRGLPRRAAADEEDVALSVFDSFCQRARRGEFPGVDDPDSLWRLLVTVTARKAARLVRDQTRRKRGGGRVAGESALAGPIGAGGGFDGLAADDPTPALEAEVTESFLRLLDTLGDETLRRIALWKMEGYTHPEIAERLGCAPATVVRRVALIRKIWEREGTDAG